MREIKRKSDSSDDPQPPVLTKATPVSLIDPPEFDFTRYEKEIVVSDKLQAKFDRFFQLKAEGIHFNERLEKNTSFHNPKIYAKLVEFVDIDEHGSNLDQYNPKGFPSSAYAEEILNAQKTRAETKSRIVFVKEKQ